MTAITKHPEEVPPYSITSILYQGTSWIFKEEMENEYKYAYFNRYHKRVFDSLFIANSF